MLFLIAGTIFASTTGSLFPQSDGNYTQWTPSTGASHFALVDESVCNGTSDYNKTTTVGNRDSYTVDISSLPSGAKITQVAIKPCASRDGTGSGTSVLKVFYRFNGTNGTDSGSYSLTSGNTPAELATTSMGGLSLLYTATSTMEIGAVYSSGTKGLRLSRIIAVVTYTPLASPTSLTASATTTSAAGLTWSYSTNSNADGFTIDRSLDAVAWSGIATTTSSTSKSYYDSGLSANTTYYYRVRAYNFGAYSSYTNTATSTTLDTPPAAPSNLNVSISTSTGTTTLVLNWSDNSSNELGFKVERNWNSGGFVQYATTTSNTITYTDNGPLNSGTYVYRVRAYNTGGNSTYSTSATTTLP